MRRDGEVVRVLVADDDADAVALVSGLLQQESWCQVVGTAAGGRGAVAEALRLGPEVVLMDAMMLDHTGLEACRTIKDHLPESKIIIVSGFASEGWLEPAAAYCGATGLLSKDRVFEALAAAVKRVVGLEPEDQLGRPILGFRTLPTPAEPPDWVFSAGGQSDVDYRAAGNGGDTGASPALLTKREREVLELLKAGQHNREIAESLELSENTVEKHVASLLAKLGVSRRSELLPLFLRYRTTTD